MVLDSVNAFLAEGKRVLRLAVLRSIITCVLIWALGVLVGIAISVAHSHDFPGTSTWMFVMGVTALPATVAGQLAGVITVVLALSRLPGAVLRLPQAVVQQVLASGRNEPVLAPLVQKSGRSAQLPSALLSVAGVTLLTTLLTARVQPPSEKLSEKMSA
jgi:hypothetical protein